MKKRSLNVSTLFLISLSSLVSQASPQLCKNIFSSKQEVRRSAIGPQRGLIPKRPRASDPRRDMGLVAPSPRTSFAPFTSEALIKFGRTVQTSQGESLVVKVIYDVRAPLGQNVHFIDTNKFEFHYLYAAEAMGYRGSNEEFNQKNYGGRLDQRQYAPVSLVLEPSSDRKNIKRILLELWTGDSMDGAGIEKLLAQIQSQLPPGTELKFHPLSVEQETTALRALAKSRYILTKELYGDLPYMALNQGVAVGYLKFASAQSPGHEASPYDLRHIVVFDQVPNELGMAGGVITSEPQTPLSHVNVKSINRKTVNMYLREARENLKKYDGQPVELKVTVKGYEIRVLDPGKDGNPDQVIADFWKARKPRLNAKITSIIDPSYDRQLVRLDKYYAQLPSRAEHQRLIQIVGAKAANLALLELMVQQLRSNRFGAAPAVGIPFNFFDVFMSQKVKGLDPSQPNTEIVLRDLVVRMLNQAKLLDTSILHPIEVVGPALTEVRKVMASASCPPELLKLLKNLIYEDATSPIHISKVPRLRFRSSTNSEDLDGFTGAGLYDSAGINLYKKTDGQYDMKKPRSWEQIEKDIADLIPSLYSNIWNERAYLEREWFSLDGDQHLAVKSGLAVHGAFPLKYFNGEPGEIANGVAVTANIYNPAEPAKLYVNAQHYDFAVTNPPTKEELTKLGEDPNQKYSTEEFLITTFLADTKKDAEPDSWKEWAIERLRSTSVRQGQSVLRAKGESGSQRDEVRELARVIRYINDQAAYVYGKPAENFPIDVEWKLFGPERKIIIKQFRPFTPPEIQDR